MLLKHICEVCGKEEIIDSEDAYKQGWDYPPKMGVFGVVSARTCPNCPINETVWWKIAVKNKQSDELSEKDLQTIQRILAEPSSILVEMSENDKVDDNSQNGNV